MGIRRALGWWLAGALLLAPTVVRAEEPVGDRLFPFGVRTDGRPDRVDDAGKPRTAAVRAGLEWLKVHQNPNGMWNAEDLSWCNGTQRHANLVGKGKALYDVGVTGLAICAFLSAGYTHLDGGAHAETIGRGLKALANAQDGDGCFGGRGTQHYLYCHAFACLAYVEAFVITGDERLRLVAKKGLAFSSLARNPYFAWRYGIKPGDNDTSMTGCVSMAFLAARLANEAALAAGEEPPLPFSRDVLLGIRAWIDKMSEAAYGRTGYIQQGGAPARPQELIDKYPGDRSESCTAIGLLLRLHVPGEDAQLDALLNRKAIRLLHGLPPKWNIGSGDIDHYYWYYGCLALTRAGADAWRPWARAIESALISSQHSDGDPGTYLGSWDPSGPWGPDGGRIYSTAVCILMLQAPYRFPALPPDRSDLIAALGRAGRTTTEQVRLLDAVASFRVPDAERTLRDWIERSDVAVRAAATRALAACHPSKAGIKILGRLLTEDPAAPVRCDAAAGLGRIGDEAAVALSSLEQGTGDVEITVRVASLATLRGLGRKAAKAAPTVAALLAHEATPVRVGAAGALQRIAPETPDVEKTLLAGLGDAAGAVRRRAAAYLADAGPGSPAVHTALTEALKDADAAVRVEAARGVVQGSHEPAAIVAVVRTGLASKELDVREGALQLVLGLGPRATEVTPLVLPGALEGPVRIRIATARALGTLGVGAPGAAAVLHACRNDVVPAVRDLAIEGCRAMRVDPAPLVLALRDALTAKDRRIVRGAATGLVECGKAAVDPLRELLGAAQPPVQAMLLRILLAIGKDAQPALPDVLAILDGTEAAEVRREGARALGALEASSEKAADLLIRIVENEEDYWTRNAATLALGYVGRHQQKAVDFLSRRAALEKEDMRYDRLAALEAMALLGPAAAPVLPALLDALGDEDALVRTKASTVVAAIGEPALDVLMDAVKGVHSDYRTAALRAIALMGDEAKRVVPDLAKLLAESRTQSAYAYAETLGGIGKASVRALKKLLRSKNAMVRAASARGLGQVGPDAKSALSSLKRLLKDKSSGVRSEAKAAIALIKPD